MKTPIILPDEARAKEEALDNIIFERLADYIGSHILEFKFPNNRPTVADNELEEG